MAPEAASARSPSATTTVVFEGEKSPKPTNVILGVRPDWRYGAGFSDTIVRV
jgi:hypothetical protein